MRRLLLAAAASALFAGPAYAVDFWKTTLGPESHLPPLSNVPVGLYTIDFNSGLVAGLGGDFQLVQGFKDSEYAQPYGGTDLYLSVPSTPVGPQPWSATLDLTQHNLGGIVTGFSLYWGSIDLYNTLRIKTSLEQLDFAFTGTNGFPAMPPPPANGAQKTPENNRRIFFTLSSGEELQSLSFISTGIAFEVDDIVFTGIAVPEPSTWAMMIAGFGLVGGAMRRRNREAKAALSA